MSTVSALRRLRVGARRSPLSLAQTREVLSDLEAAHPGTEFVVVEITTGGDRDKDAPLLSLGRGTFVKDIEVALLEGEVDFAVHSAKDLSPDMLGGLTIGAIARRQDPRDVLVNRWGLALKDLPEGARLGTSSPRREAQIRAVRPDVQVLPIRGNVGTRLEKARGDQYDGVVLAAAGLLRLGLEAEISEFLSPEEFTPEAGQGALAIQARSDDSAVLKVVESLAHRPSSIAFRAERAFIAALGGGCKVPVAAYARLDGRELPIDGMVALPDGSRILRAHLVGDPENPESSGRALANELSEAGSAEIRDIG